MAKVLVIQHVPHEGLGTIGPALSGAGLGADFLKVYEDKVPRGLEGYSALVVLGGPMGVYEDGAYPFIKEELALIQRALKSKLPTLGVCLGSQLLAKAAGADVYKGKAKEIGWYTVSLTDEGVEDPLLLGFPEEFTVFQWHGDTFDVPEDGVNLAGSKLFPNQLIKVGPRAYGVQFHLEVTEAMVREWVEINRDELGPLKGKVDPDRIIKETPSRIEGLHRLGKAFLARFLRLIEK